MAFYINNKRYWKRFLFFSLSNHIDWAIISVHDYMVPNDWFFLYCLLSATQSEQKYDPLWACDPQVEENWIKKTLLYCCFLDFVYFTFVQLLCSICCKAYLTASRGAGGGSWFLYVVREVTGFKSCSSRQLCWGWLQRHRSKQEKQHKVSTKSVYQSISLLFWINWAIFDIIHKKWSHTPIN